MALVDLLRRAYHALLPLGVRRKLRLTRFSESRRARARLWQRTGGRVAAGPMRDLRLPGDVPDDCYGTALMGAYECETHLWLDAEIARGWRAVVNIGSSEGHYAVAMALRLPQATVYAFEMDEALRRETRTMAERNGVLSRIVTLGTADLESMAALPIESALVISDCEGAERELIDPVAVPWLAKSAMLVELHDMVAPGTTEVLQARFAATHDITIVQQGPRDAAEWARRAGVSVADAAMFLEEVREHEGAHLDQRWMQLTPRGL
jgi:hypothetical protein